MTEREPSEASAQKPRKSGRTDFREFISFARTLLIFFVIAIFFNASVVQAFKIPSGSMIPTLRIGDHIFVSKFSYGLRIPWMSESIVQWSTPRRGDVVVFTKPDEPSVNVIKRVIGLPGETVEVIGDKVYINGAFINEPYARWAQGGSGGRWAPERVPEGHVFLLGDNRDFSRDSRYWPNPYLDIKWIKGRALLIYFSPGPDFFSRLGKIIH